MRYNQSLILIGWIRAPIPICKEENKPSNIRFVWIFKRNSSYRNFIPEYIVFITIKSNIVKCMLSDSYLFNQKYKRSVKTALLCQWSWFSVEFIQRRSTKPLSDLFYQPSSTQLQNDKRQYAYRLIQDSWSVNKYFTLLVCGHHTLLIQVFHIIKIYMDWKERGSSSAHVVPRSFFKLKELVLDLKMLQHHKHS